MKKRKYVKQYFQKGLSAMIDVRVRIFISYLTNMTDMTPLSFSLCLTASNNWARYRHLNEAPISKANNLKVTIGALKLVSRNETKTSKAKRIEVFKSNYPIAKSYWELSPKRSVRGYYF